MAPPPATSDAIQLTGAGLILLAYLLLQLGKITPRSSGYLLPNFVGAGLLAYEAARTDQIGFFVLEGTWSLISLIAWVRWFRSPPPEASEDETRQPGIPDSGSPEPD